MESRYFENVSDGVRCTICPHLCVIQENKRGRCGTKVNQGGKIIDLSYGRVSAVAVDPIEKKPLAHFYPGSLALSISSIGCNFTCPWCQNYNLSMSDIDEAPTRHMDPQSVVEAALANNCTSIAYTYNEPLINLNYVEDTAKLAHKAGVKNVLVTNGYTNIPAFSHVVEYIDAANVDWKGWTQDFYHKYCSAELQKVVEATEYMHSHGVHVEITYLIIPTVNDSPEEIRGMAEYIYGSLGEDTPLHLSRFFPMYKFQHLYPTPVETLINAKKIAQEAGLHYVYIGNVRGEGGDTFCPNCGQRVVKRVGYTITEWNLTEDNKCTACGEPIPIKGTREIHPHNPRWL